MRDPAIRVVGLGKSYAIGALTPGYRTLRDMISAGAAEWMRRLKSLGSNSAAPRRSGKDTVWALRDVSLEFRAGEVVGIIGRNGAGKSTLLKILSRITEPTEGRVEIRGRVGSLLEVGTGFHPELTGRENVYLNGAILGMKRAEVDKKFDEIVAFAEIEKFIDTPVKHYSSGMYVRLAFSVAAHLETDVLLVDEVLSVGDAKFQQKCMGRMQDRTFAGKTILFVSHNLPAVANLCERAVLLAEGRVVQDGQTRGVIEAYIGGTGGESSRDLADAPRRSTKPPLWRWMRRASLSDNGVETGSFAPVGEWTLRVDCDIPEEAEGRTLNFGFTIENGLGEIVLGANTRQYGLVERAQAGDVRFEAFLKRLSLAPGRYYVSLFLGDLHSDHEIIERALAFEVIWTPTEACSLPPHCGMLFEPVKWRQTNLCRQ